MDLNQEFEKLWPSLTVPGEYDSMDSLDRQRWRGVILQAYHAATLATARKCAEICSPSLDPCMECGDMAVDECAAAIRREFGLEG